MVRKITACVRVLIFVGICLNPVTQCCSAPGKTVLVGLNIPLSGAYVRQGEDQLRAYQLAIDVLNESGGILGHHIVYAVRDTGTDASKAGENAVELMDLGAVLVTGGASSASAITQSKVCQQRGVVFMAGLTHSNATTGKEGHRYSFRWYNNGHQTAGAIAGILHERYGQNATYAFLYADYTWGRTLKDSLGKVIEKDGGRVILSLPTPLGSDDFISELIQVKRAGPDVLVLIHFGSDMVSSLKQATMLRLRENMAIVVPLMEINMAVKLGPEIMQGILTSMCWYHGLSEKYEGSRQFVTLFEQRYHKKPGNSAAVAWVNMMQFAEAVQQAGSFAANDIVLALEGHHFTLLGSDEYWRSWDHQGIHPTYIALGKTPEESRSKWDLFTIISESSGKLLARTRRENPVVLEPLMKGVKPDAVR